MGTPFEENPSLESIDTQSQNPTKISDKAIDSFSTFGIKIDSLIRKGKYGAIYWGQFTKELSADTFANQFKCVSLHTNRRPEVGQKFAVKYVDVVVRKQLGIKDVSEAIDREIRVLMSTHFYAIVSLLFAVKLTKEHWYLFLPLADGNLQTLLRRKRHENQTLSYELSKTWIKTLVEGLKYLHEKGITHGSFKLSNVLFFRIDTKDRIELKIADFVLSEMTTEEQIKNQTTDEKHVFEDKKSDDLIDAYFVFTNIFKLTEFTNKELKSVANDSIQCLITSEDEITSIRLLDSVLKSKYLSN